VLVPLPVRIAVASVSRPLACPVISRDSVNQFYGVTMKFGILTEDLPPQPSTGGGFPSWAALVGMVVCPLIGMFIVGLTTWNLRSKVLVGIGGSTLWIVAVGLMIVSHRAGPTGA
jgi:hypothetical protein